MRIRRVLLLVAVAAAVAAGGQVSAEEDAHLTTDSKGKKMIDSLATNLAGAFMNSLFPQVSQAKKSAAQKPSKEEEVVVEEDPVLPPSPSREIRRSPVAYPQGLSVPLGQYSARQVAENYNAIPQDVPIDPRDPLAFQKRPAPLYLGAQQHLSQEYQFTQQDAAAAAGRFSAQDLAEARYGRGEGLAAALAEGEQPRDPFQGLPSSFANRRRAPSMSEPIAMGSMPKESGFDALMPEPAAILAGASSNPGGMDAVNTLRNRQYMAKLAQHQHELQTYSLKQMEYLDNQRRYQQQMIDHQAGAALLMQQQQQQLLEEQIDRAKQLQENPFTAMSEAGANSPDNTVGGRLLTADNTGDDGKRRSAGHKRTYSNDDMVVTDDNLKKYFKEQYGIDIPEDGSQLTDDERDTLRLLRQELQDKKEEAIQEGSFKTMTKLKGKVMREMQEREYSSSSRSRPDNSLNSRKISSCPPCVPVKLKEIQGAWTQIYGNAASLKKTFSTIMSLEDMASVGSRTLSMTSKKPVCVGMEVNGKKKDKAALNVFFRDDSSENDVHEMKGDLFLQDDNSLLLSTDMYNSQVCVIKAGPAEVPQLEYIVLAETGGSHPCSSVHVFTRNIDEFQLRFYDDFAEFMKTKLRHKEILPISKLPLAEMCQLP
ncbi:hypothetical protein PENTCL1PPCAC_28050 [Pristionchus entomophagus]|uniref:Uncharacterized protein n=1 Tax=Pristionchus entomophagus TaxID=358040 RepID=A0AAV5UFU0_9BILA|nr:hypothetical protein PENTCL1PPCAC_28050 [Pristionchus entomophagus]